MTKSRPSKTHHLTSYTFKRHLVLTSTSITSTESKELQTIIQAYSALRYKSVLGNAEGFDSASDSQWAASNKHRQTNSIVATPLVQGQKCKQKKIISYLIIQIKKCNNFAYIIFFNYLLLTKIFNMSNVISILDWNIPTKLWMQFFGVSYNFKAHFWLSEYLILKRLIYLQSF